MKTLLLKLEDHKGYACDSAGFLWKLGKTNKPIRPMKHPLGRNVYFVVTIDKQSTRIEQKDLEARYYKAMKSFVEDRT